MNCDDLTGEEAVRLYEDSLPLEGYRERRLEIMKSRHTLKQYEKALGYKVKYGVGDTSVRADFRGFLQGESYVIYIGDNNSIYWNHKRRIKGTHPTEHSKWGSWNPRGYNGFGVPHMIDITDLICKGWKGQFINWRTDPFEVKS